MERKIKQVRFYQAIEWEGAQTTFIRPDMSQMGGVRIHGSKHVDIKRTDDGVVLSSEKDCVEVFAANIAYIAYEMTAPATKSAKPDSPKSSKGA